MTRLMACHECDLIHRATPLPNRGAARCVRCGALLYRRRDGCLDRTLALAVAGLILFAVANAFPFLSMRIEANVQEITLLSGVRQLWDQGLRGLALLVLATSVAAPLLKLGALVAVLGPLRLGRAPAWGARLFRLVRLVAPWAMVEVFLLGILVAMVKLSSMADILLGTSLYAFAGLILVLAGVSSSLDEHAVWARLEEPWLRRG